MTANDLTVAYPGREGAHSAAACDRLFSAARLVPVAHVLRRRRRRAVGPRPLRRAADRELPRRARRRDTRPPLRIAALDRGGGDPAGEPLPRRPRRGRASPTSARCTRTPWRSTSAGASSPRCRTRRRSPRRRPATRQRSWPRSATRPSSRSQATAPPGSTASRSSTANVGDHPEAYTRFVSIAPYTRLDRRDGQWRTAFSFTTDHRPGALLRALEPLARHGIDLNLLVSRPIPSTPWSYRFDAVLAGHPLDPEISATLRELRDLTTHATRVRLVPRGSLNGTPAGRVGRLPTPLRGSGGTAASSPAPAASRAG